MLFVLSSRPKRHRDLLPTIMLWRGAEGSRGIVLGHAAPGCSPLTASHWNLVGVRKLFAKSSSPMLPESITQSGENSLTQHGKGCFLGVSPLRAEGFLCEPTASWRPGRDDRMRELFKESGMAKALVWRF